MVKRDLFPISESAKVSTQAMSKGKHHEGAEEIRLLREILSKLEHLHQEIRSMANVILQPILDAVGTGFSNTNTSLQEEFSEIQSKLDELLAKIAAGGNVSAEDVQAVADQVTASATAVTTSVDEETAKIKAIEPPA